MCTEVLEKRNATEAYHRWQQRILYRDRNGENLLLMYNTILLQAIDWSKICKNTLTKS